MSCHSLAHPSQLIRSIARTLDLESCVDHSFEGFIRVVTEDFMPNVSITIVAFITTESKRPSLWFHAVLQNRAFQQVNPGISYFHLFIPLLSSHLLT